MAALLGFSLAWYVVVRAISPWTAKPLPDPITLKIQFPYQYHGDRDGEHQITSENEVGHGAMA